MQSGVSPQTARRARAQYAAVLALAVAALAGLRLAFGLASFPPPLSDAVFHIPPALSHEAGTGLANPLWDLTATFDTTGQSRFLQYPPLFALTLSALMWEATPRAAFVVIALMDAASLALCGLVFFRLLCLQEERFRWLTAAIAVAGLAGLTTRFAYHHDGRPEALGTVFVVAASAVAMRTSTRLLWLALGVFLGLLGATHPVGAILLAGLIGMYFAARCRTSTAIQVTAAHECDR
jgi:hypothetical protein